MKPIRSYGGFEPFLYQHSGKDRVDHTTSIGGLDKLVVVSYGGYAEYFYDDGQTDEEFIAEYKLQLAKFVLEGG